MKIKFKIISKKKLKKFWKVLKVVIILKKKLIIKIILFLNLNPIIKIYLLIIKKNLDNNNFNQFKIIILNIKSYCIKNYLYKIIIKNKIIYKNIIKWEIKAIIIPNLISMISMII
jgi:hypothetical protein